MFRLPALAALALILVCALGSSRGASAAPSSSTTVPTFSGIACVDFSCGDLSVPAFEIIALVGSTQCGQTMVYPVQDGPAQFVYTIDVASADETPGCGTEGAAVTFEANGQPANESGIWHSETTRLDLTFGDPMMVLTGKLFRAGVPWEGAGGGGFYIGPMVRAYVDGTLCAEKQTVTGSSGAIGYNFLVIPPVSHTPGCGTTGATVTFTLDGAPADQTVSWLPGFYNQDLSVTGASDESAAHFSGHACIDSNCEGAARIVTASINGVICAEESIPVIVDGPVNQAYYRIDVPSAADVPGCGTEGRTVDFAINAKPSITRGVWHAGPNSSLDLVAGEPFAAFSGAMTLNNSPLPRDPAPVLKAFIGSVECGVRSVGSGYVPDTVTTVGNYMWLMVLSAGSRPGCGTEGAKITLTLNETPTTETAMWSPGFHTLDLSAETAAGFGKQGGPPGDPSRSGWPLAAGLALITAGLLAVLLCRSRRNRERG